MSEHPITYYGRRQRHTYWCCALLVAAAMILRGGPAGAPWSAGQGHLMLAVAQAVLLAGLVLAGPGSTRVTVGPDGVLVRNMFRSHQVAWPDVRGFSLDEERFPYVTRLSTADGEVVVQAISDEPWISFGAERDRNQQMIEALNGHWRAILAGHRLGTEAVAPTPVPEPATV